MKAPIKYVDNFGIAYDQIKNVIYYASEIVVCLDPQIAETPQTNPYLPDADRFKTKKLTEPDDTAQFSATLYAYNVLSLLAATTDVEGAKDVWGNHDLARDAFRTLLKNAAGAPQQPSQP